MRGEDLAEALAAQEAAWPKRGLLRRLYSDWYRNMVARLSAAEPTVELGSGIGRFREHHPTAVLTDIAPTPWAEAVVDAADMPYGDATIGNLVLFDVFHHLADPATFFDEAARVLKRGGRVVINDPYCSPVSTIAYRRFHDERTDLNGPSLEADPRIQADPRESNQARAKLVFFRDRAAYAARWPELPVVERRLLSPIAYPLSGGFTGSKLAPGAFYRPLSLIEDVLRPLGPLLAFRCLIVLERR